MSHWKIALDIEAAQVFIGSYNLNHRSEHNNFELNVLIKSKNLSSKVMDML